MGRGDPASPRVFDDDFQMRQTPKSSYVDFQGVILEVGHEQSFEEQEPKIPA